MKEEILTVRIKKSAGDTMRIIVDTIINIFKKYEIESTRKIYISRWI